MRLLFPPLLTSQYPQKAMGNGNDASCNCGSRRTGAALALLLVKRGIAVTLVEAAKDAYRVFRGEGLMPSGLDAIAQMGLSTMLEGVPHRQIDAWEFVVAIGNYFELMSQWVKSTLYAGIATAFAGNTNFRSSVASRV